MELTHLTDAQAAQLADQHLNLRWIRDGLLEQSVEVEVYRYYRLDAGPLTNWPGIGLRFRETRPTAPRRTRQIDAVLYMDPIQGEWEVASGDLDLHRIM